MARAFSLQAVLQLRLHKEAAEERALLTLAAHIGQVEATLGRVRHEMRQWAEDRGREVGQPGTGNTQQSSYARLGLLRDAEAQLVAQLEQLAAQRLAQQVVLTTARRARETLTELKQQQDQAFADAEDRREQRRLEDLFLGRWSR